MTIQCTFPYPLQPNTLTCTQPAVEFQINTDALHDYSPTVAALNDGGFVVVWNDNSVPFKIHGRKYDSAGTPAAAGEFQINTDTLIDTYPTITALNDGGFVVVWQDNTNPTKIHGQRYDSAGAVVGAEFQVNTDTLNDSRPTIAALNDGGFVVVWGDNTGTKKIHGQRYDSAGAPSDVTGKTVPSSTLLCDTPNSCVASNTIFDPTTQGTYTLSTQKIAPISDVLCTSGQVCASSGSPADHCVTTSYQCAAPANIFDSTTQGTYTLSTEKVVPISGSQVCTSSAPSSSNAWPAASIATTAVLGVSTVIGWGLCVYKYLSSASTAGQVLPAHLEDGQVSDGQMTDGRFVRESNVKTTNQIVVGTALQVALPVLILNLQMQVTNAAQTIDQAATWLTSLFDEKAAALDDEVLDVSELSYPYQEMYVDSQNFDFLSASNDTMPSYDYYNFG